MITLTQLHQQRGELVTQARAATNEIAANTDDARVAELETRSDRIFADLDALDATIARETRMAAEEARQEELRAQNRPTGADGETRGQDGGGQGEQAGEAEYRDAFHAYLRAGGDLTSIDSEQRNLLRRGHQEMRTQVAGTDAAGGYTVPTELANRIVQTMKDWGPMYDPGITDEIVTSSGNPFDIPTNDDTGNSAAALAEAADPTDDNSGDMVFGEKNLSAFVYATPWLKISFELLQDSAFNLESFIGGKLGERLGRLANNKLTVGTGAGQPNGIVTASSLGKTAAAAAAIAADELIDLQHSVNAAYRRSPKCGWMFRDTTLAVIRKLKDGQGNYVWSMGDVRIGAPDLLLGKPYHVNDDVAAIATAARTVIFGDLNAYLVRKVGRPVIGTVRERFFPKVGMIGLIRFDGELTDTAAVKHLVQA